MGTVCAIFLVTLMVGMNIWRLVWNKKKGRSSCGCSGCSGCCGNCGGKCNGSKSDNN